LAEEAASPPLDAFDYRLPPDRIAQEPAERRDAARLLVLRRGSSRLEDATVQALPALLRAGDCLVVNDTRVVAARLFGRVRGSQRAVEVLLLRATPGAEADPAAGVEWEALVRPARPCPPGTVLWLADGAAEATVTGAGAAGQRRLAVRCEGTVEALLAAHGLPPLPPYIRRYRKPSGEDWTRYQTVYATAPGAVAAPTAGLHFTPALLAALVNRGVELHRLTLHVGPGTFRPVRATRLADHRMAPEAYEVPVGTATALSRARREGRRIVAVGTTTVRALETVADAGGSIGAGAGWTELTIVPGYRVRAVDGLLTNFHLPRSSLLLLVAALAGREAVLDAYRHAAAGGYRFYSYGDAMLIL
jgi:S-adenosylmethionine:tRNA ribosyltransferase-isomerase